MDTGVLPKGHFHPKHVRHISDLSDLDEPLPTPPNHPPLVLSATPHEATTLAQVADAAAINAAAVVETGARADAGAEVVATEGSSPHRAHEALPPVPMQTLVQRPPQVMPAAGPSIGSGRHAPSSGHSTRSGTERPSLTSVASSLPVTASSPGLARKLARLGQLASKRPNYVFQPSPRGGFAVLGNQASNAGGAGAGPTGGSGGRSRYMQTAMQSPCLSPSRVAPGRSPLHGRSPTKLTAGCAPGHATPSAAVPRHSLLLGPHVSAVARSPPPRGVSQRCSRSPEPNVFTRLAGGAGTAHPGHSSPLTGSLRSLPGHSSPPGQRSQYCACFSSTASLAATGQQPPTGGAGSLQGSLRSISSLGPQSPSHAKRAVMYPIGMSRNTLTQPRVGGPAVGNQPTWSSGPGGYRHGGYVDTLSRSMSSVSTGQAPLVIAPAASVDNLNRSAASMQAFSTGGTASPGPYIRLPPSIGSHRGGLGGSLGGGGCTGGGAGTLGSPVGHPGATTSSPPPPHARWCFSPTPMTPHR